MGLENYELIKKRIDQINNLKLKEQSAFEEAGINFVSDREIQTIIKNLVTEEIAKSQKFVFSNEMKISSECFLDTGSKSCSDAI